MTSLAVEASARHAETLVDLLVDEGPLTSAEACDRLGWSKGRFGSALRHARDVLCPSLGIAIPHPTPAQEWRYQVTTDWAPVEAGASYSLGLVESRLRSVHRDVQLIEPHMKRGTTEWRRARFLNKHLTHILGTLKEINDG